ncbi:MAG: hypothetical protein QXP29_02295 [Candidatus Nezhaarchaeales archaeon]
MPVVIGPLFEIGERILGMLPQTFAAFILPIVIIVIITLIWALRWTPPPE